MSKLRRPQTPCSSRGRCSTWIRPGAASSASPSVSEPLCSGSSRHWVSMSMAAKTPGLAASRRCRGLFRSRTRCRSQPRPTLPPPRPGRQAAAKAGRELRQQSGSSGFHRFAPRRRLGVGTGLQRWRRPSTGSLRDVLLGVMGVREMGEGRAGNNRLWRSLTAARARARLPTFTDETNPCHWQINCARAARAPCLLPLCLVATSLRQKQSSPWTPRTDAQKPRSSF